MDLFPYIRHIDLVFLFRLTPVAAYVVCSRTTGSWTVFAATLAFTVAAAAAVALQASAPLLWILLGYAYHLACCAFVYLVAAPSRMRGLPSPLLFLVLVGPTLVAPALLAPASSRGTILVVGWDILLSGYSYCLERNLQRRTFGDCVFFLLVNPTLVYSQRGHRAGHPRGRSAALLRAGLGIGILFANVALLRELAGSVPPTATAAFWVVGALQFTSLYAAHSGLAHLQIGLLRSVGWVVPERYNFPFLARSPREFWQRWNVYVRVWLEHYVFLPVSTWMYRRTRSNLAIPACIFVTFLACGALHDLYATLLRFSWSGRGLQLFVLVGGFVAVTRMVSPLGRVIRQRMPWAGAPLSAAARLTLGAAVLCAASWWN